MTYTFLGYEEINTNKVHTNPLNPRAKFMLADDDPYLIELGASIATEGQFKPALVYELVGHYAHDDAPGEYMLLQGESRLRGARIGGVETFRVFKITVPEDEQTEYQWIGNEEVYKRDWQPFFKYRYAVSLANSMGIDVVSQSISTKTGLSLSDLEVAKKVFSLEPEIQALVAEYEELMYEQHISGKRKKKARLAPASGVVTKEFPTYKAATVYDIAVALRTNYAHMVSSFDDRALQHLLSMKASRCSAEDLTNFCALLTAMGSKPTPDFIIQLNKFLSMPSQGVKGTLLNVGSSRVSSLELFNKKTESLTKLTRTLIKHSSQLGTDRQRLVDAQMINLRLKEALSDLDQAIAETIRNI